MNTYVTTSTIEPAEAQMAPADFAADKWTSTLSVAGCACKHHVLIDVGADGGGPTKAVRMSAPDGMPGPDAAKAWEGKPMTVHVFELDQDNITESHMAFERWVVDYVHAATRSEY